MPGSDQDLRSEFSVGAKDKGPNILVPEVTVPSQF